MSTTYSYRSHFISDFCSQRIRLINFFFTEYFLVRMKTISLFIEGLIFSNTPNTVEFYTWSHEITITHILYTMKYAPIPNCFNEMQQSPYAEPCSLTYFLPWSTFLACVICEMILPCTYSTCHLQLAAHLCGCELLYSVKR